RNLDFMTRFVKVLVHSRFTVPVVLNPVDAQGHTQIGFMAVDRQSLTGETEKAFALFSDGQALKSWKLLYKEGKGPNTMCITFQDAVSIMRKNNQ
ncbi:SseB family protein, partial [Acinetobacter soli]|uniref:SseB family protein n=1 Tax=Acinetobacter soli TaxID=487316 RepID=UPI002813E97A